MKFLVLLVTLALAGCFKTVPVRQTFPEAPKTLTERCEKLKKVEGDRVAITEMLKVVIENYTLYHECSTKVDGWNEWYESQKKIYESLK